MDSADRESIDRIRTGDRAAFERLVRRWDTNVLNLAYRMTSNLEDAKDVRQLAFLRVHGALERFDGRAPFSTWLYGIVLNLCRDRLRSRRSRQRLIDKAGELEHTRLMECKSADDAASEVEHKHQIAAAIRSLPRIEREAVVLRHYQGLPFVEIAAILGAPPSTIKSRMMRALKRLRAQLDPKEIRTHE